MNQGIPAGPESSGTDAATVGAVELRHVPAFVAVTLTTQGEYSCTAEPFSRLKAWADSIDVLAAGNAICVLYGSPSWGSNEHLRYSLCLPVSRPDAAKARDALAAPAAPLSEATLHSEQGRAAPGARAAGDPSPGDVVEVRDFPRILAAVAYYRGPSSGSGTVYESVMAWVRERPYLPTGAPREAYLVEPDRLRHGLREIEVQQPIIPKAGGSRVLR